MSSQIRHRKVIVFLIWSMAAVGWAQLPPQPTAIQGLPNTQRGPQAVPTANGPNFGFAAVPLNSLSVTLSWQAVPGTTGMAVYREGNVIATLPSTTFSFVDRNVKPFGRYTYHLRANGITQVIGGRATALPVDSPSITVDVPPPAVPAGFSAQLISGNVKLTWNSVPEASRYEVDLGGRTVAVMAGTTPTFTDSAPNNRDATYAIRTVVQAYDGSMTPGYWSNKLTIRVRPFIMIVAGDSIMWGQGLSPAHKFTTRFRDYLASMLGGPGRMQVFDHSHSGAILGQEADVDNATGPTDVTSAVFGELPADFPSVPRQALVLSRRDLQQYRLQLEDVDLVLMDGCINDVTVGSLLNPATKTDQIAAMSVDYCNRRMTTTLSQIHSTYKNANVLVTGYYSIVSPESNPVSVFGWTTTLGLIPATAAGLIPGGGTATVATAATAVSSLATAAAPAVWGAAVAHSKTFIDASNSMLQSAVLNANTLAGAAGPPYVKFVSPSFQDANAFAAPQSMLWLLALPPTPPNAFDEVFADRSTMCTHVAHPPANCLVASAGHPNAAGALTYANTLITAVNTYLPGWRAQFSLMVQLPAH